MLEYMPACKGVKRLAGQGHRLRLAFSSTTGLCLCIYLAVPQRGQFTVLQLVATDNNRYSLDHISSLFTTQVHCSCCRMFVFTSVVSLSIIPLTVFTGTSCSQETLVDFVLTSTDIWGIWVDDSNTSVVKYINFEQ